MNIDIHPQALVEEGAHLEEDVTVERGAIIRNTVKIGKGTHIGPYSVIEGYTTIGGDCHIFSHTVVGSISQDLKYKGQKTFLEIGDSNTIREFVTINPGTEEGTFTRIGSNNLIMAYSHIAHNCLVGNNCILANAATLAGHVQIDDGAVIGGLVAIHQFCRVGALSIIGGCSKVVQDIPPYSMCDGHPAQIRGLNIVGLKRKGFAVEVIISLKKAFKILFFSSLSFSSAFKILEDEGLLKVGEVKILVDFIKSSSRGVCRPR